MDIARFEIAGEKLFVWLLIFLGLIGAVFAGMMVGSNPLPVFIVFSTLILSVTWIAAARERWWLLVPPAAILGGFFYFGYKIYPHEIALFACALPLALLLALRAAPMRLRRSPFPATMYILGTYLIAHWLGSNIYNWTEGAGGYGNVTRAYSNACWVIFFVFLLWRYGSTKYIAGALLLCYLAAFVRVVVGIVFYLSETLPFIPVINYVLPGSAFTQSDDLRWSGLALATLSICYFLIKKGALQKTFHAIIFFGSCVALLLGSGRTVVVLVALLPLFVSILYRKAVVLFVTSAALVALVFVINSSPTVLNPLPDRVQRSLSILLLDKDEANFYGKTGASDEWHEGLRKIAYSKWMQSWATVFFGTGIRPFNITVSDVRAGSRMTMEDMMYSASNTGSYESGWWTVIGVTGFVGLVLYASVLFYLLRKLVPTLLRERVTSHSHAFAFMSVFGIVIWIGLGWTNGSFPSTEILFGFLALAALEDRQIKHQPQDLNRPQRLMPQHALVR